MKGGGGSSGRQAASCIFGTCLGGLLGGAAGAGGGDLEAGIVGELLRKRPCFIAEGTGPLALQPVLPACRRPSFQG
jgi:hypothetical protein